MIQTNLSPEVKKWLDDHPAYDKSREGKLEDLRRERAKADRNARSVTGREWTALDRLLVLAILACAALLVKLLAGS